MIRVNSIEPYGGELNFPGQGDVEFGPDRVEEAS